MGGNGKWEAGHRRTTNDPMKSRSLGCWRGTSSQASGRAIPRLGSVALLGASARDVIPA